MDKQKYYVTVGTGEILPDKTLSEWEFEIEASEEEAGHLSALFEEAEIDSAEDFWRAHIPFVPYSKNLEADRRENDHLLEIYRFLHQVGTPETREHIASMGILDIDEKKS